MKITTKLFLAIFGLTTIVLLATLSLAKWSFQQGFLDYINALEQQRLASVANSLINRYQNNPVAILQIKNSEFNQVLNNHAVNRVAMPPPRQRPPEFAPPPQKNGLFGVDFPPPKHGPKQPETTLTDAQGNYLVGDKSILTHDDIIQYNVVINNRVIAKLWSEPKRQFSTVQATEFAQMQQNTSILIGIFFLIFAAILAQFLAKRLVNPLNDAISAIKQLANGNYQLPSLPKQQDEIGQLINDIQQLANTLEQNQSAKNRWLANISHELRTPLTILTGELEMIEAGIRKLDSQQLQSFKQEVTRLMSLVDDLYQLSLADIGGLRYQFQRINLTECIEQALATTASKIAEAQLQLSKKLTDPIWVKADQQRLTQLFINLIVNSCYYTDAPGQLVISTRKENQQVIISFADSAPSVDEQNLPLLFDSLHRQDQARTRAKAGAGLGLTICKTIVEAHQGNIEAKHAELGGIEIVITLKLDN